MLEMGLYAAIAPLGLLLLSSVWRYPAVLEEVVKWGILRLNQSSDHSLAQGSELGRGALVGLAFGLSETVLYTMNSWVSMDWSAIAWRLLLTVPMHVGSACMSAWGIKYERIYEGLGCAMLIHVIFNYLLV
ncbi:MAG: PrsW family glutamic-type intramembrane protease [Microgenomates group bacterium]